MSPKDKAIELYNKFYGIPLYIKNVKQCCYTVVDELLNEYQAQCPEDSYEMVRHLYWIEVKQEIGKI